MGKSWFLDRVPVFGRPTAAVVCQRVVQKTCFLWLRAVQQLLSSTPNVNRTPRPSRGSKRTRSLSQSTSSGRRSRRNISPVRIEFVEHVEGLTEMELDLVQRIVKASHELPTHVHHFRHDPSHESTGFKPDEKCEDGEAVNYRSIAVVVQGRAACGFFGMNV
jgi:hypothetical protein